MWWLWGIVERHILSGTYQMQLSSAVKCLPLNSGSHTLALGGDGCFDESKWNFLSGWDRELLAQGTTVREELP